MKKSTTSSRVNKGFTLIELLVVIAIIGILAAMLLTGISTMKIIAQKTRASVEISQIVSAINKYEADYNRFPIARAAMNSAVVNNDDFTYGGTLQRPPGWFYTVQASGTYTTNNSEVMAVLLNLDSGVNSGNVMNTKRTPFLSAKMVSDVNAPGVGPDGVYRDPWGNPYIITIDANNDGKARDAFYQLSSVSAPGINGLIKTVLPNSTTVVYEVNSPGAVWSAGPDRMIDTNAPANKGANKDNIVSWK